MQDRFGNDNNKKAFDLGSVWRDVKTAYIFNLVIVLGLISTMVYFMFVAGPSCNELQHEARKEGEESGFIAGRKSGYEKAQKEIITRLLLAGIDESYVWTLADSSALQVSPIFRELRNMTDKQIVELKNIDISTLNRLRKIGTIYSGNKIECVKQLIKDKKRFWANTLGSPNSSEEENSDKPENQEPTQDNENTEHEH